MRYGTVCSGIEAPTLAWHHMGWSPAFFSEIEPFPCAVLKHRYLHVPNYGDMTKYQEWPDEAVDLIAGGTPCQSFSVAGLRKGISDPRGNLTLIFLGLLQRYQPQWVIWENVPGVLSANGGRDFACFIQGLADIGYGFAWRVLDAQFFGVPQRRRRVFLVGHIGNDWRTPAEVLFKSEGLRGHTPKGGKEGETIAFNAQASSSQDLSIGRECPTIDASKVHAVLYENHPNDSRITECGNVAPTVTQRFGTGGGNTPLVQFADVYNHTTSEVAQSLTANSGGTNTAGPKALVGSILRRLTPLSCERLQGMPDNHTRIPWRGKPAEQCPDSPRYKAIGNSMAVPVVRWIGERIQTLSGDVPEK